MKIDTLARHSLGSAQAAAYLDISLGHLYNLVADGRGPRCIKYQRTLRFCRVDLDAWIDDHCRQIPCEPPP